MSTENTALDVAGREIKAGDTLAYAGRKGSRLWLDLYEVTRVYPTGQIEARNKHPRANPERRVLLSFPRERGVIVR